MNLGLAIIISAWIHIIGLALWPQHQPLPVTTAPFPLLIELAASAEVPQNTPDDRAAASAATKEPAEDAVKNTAEDPAPDDTISIESKAPEYFPFLQQVKSRIRRNWIFPVEAQEKRQGGRLTAVFTLDNQGRLLQTRITASSGVASLDEAALEALRRAAPYPAFPDHIKLELLNINVVFDYRFQYVTVN